LTRSISDDVIGDDAGLLGVVADAAQRALAQGARLGNAEMNAIGCHVLPRPEGAERG
jgi:hypothetical protein